jgi:hypothetical protein
VTLRSLIPAGNESFRGVLTGGNGREITTGQAEFYNLDVPSGAPELNATVKLAHDPNNQMYDELVSPTGDALAFGANDTLVSVGGEPAEQPQLASQLHVLNPAAGRWTLIVAFIPTVAGNRISDPFTVTTSQTKVKASARHLPDSAATTIAAGSSRTVYVKVHNSGPSPEAYFVDPRLTTSSVQSLTSLFGSSTEEPLTFEQNVPDYLVPSETTAVGGSAVTTGPAALQADMGYFNGDPDIESATGTSITMNYSSPQVPPGVWSIAPTEVGPYSAAATPEDVDTAMVVTSRDFDPSITSATGDLWLESVDPSAPLSLITVGPGHTATIPIQITASGAPRTVSGTLFIDDADVFDIYGAPVPDGNEVAALPYTYTVTP